MTERPSAFGTALYALPRTLTDARLHTTIPPPSRHHCNPACVATLPLGYRKLNFPAVSLSAPATRIPSAIRHATLRNLGELPSTQIRSHSSVLAANIHSTRFRSRSAASRCACIHAISSHRFAAFLSESLPGRQRHYQGRTPAKCSPSAYG
jgi:hypothetical protein